MSTRVMFTEYRKDGWPLCPQCGEDELIAFLTPPGLAFLSTGHIAEFYKSKGIQDYIDSGMVCLVCHWRLDKKG